MLAHTGRAGASPDYTARRWPDRRDRWPGTRRHARRRPPARRHARRRRLTPAAGPASPRPRRRTGRPPCRRRRPRLPRSSSPRRRPWHRVGTGFRGAWRWPARRRSLLASGADAPDDVPDGIDGSVPAADHVGDQAGPAGLVECADRGAVVAVEVLTEDQVVVPGRVVLQPLGPAEAGSPAVRAAGKDRD